MPRNEGETHGRVGACVATRVVKTLSQMESLLTLMNADSEPNLSRAGACSRKATDEMLGRLATGSLA
jgi:hypothetical protein